MLEHSVGQDEIESSFQAMAEGYRLAAQTRLKEKYTGIYGGLVTSLPPASSLAREAGCEYPDTMSKFIREGRPVPHGKDLELFALYLDAMPPWVLSIRTVPVHATLVYPEPAHWLRRPLLPQEMDFAIRELLAKTTWFYFEASERFLQQSYE